MKHGEQIDSELYVINRASDLEQFESRWKKVAPAYAPPCFLYSFSTLMSTVLYKLEEGNWQCHILANDREVEGAFLATSSRIHRAGISFSVLSVEQACDCFFSPAEDNPVVDRLISSLINEFRGVSFISFDRINSASLKVIGTSVTHHGHRSLHFENGLIYYFDTNRTIVELMAAMPRNFRRSLKRQKNRLEREFDIKLQIVEPGDSEANELSFRNFQELEVSGWKGEQGTALSQDSRTKKFFEYITNQHAKDGETCWYSLLADDKPIAMYMCLNANGVHWAVKTAYDAAYAAYSPGNELLLRILEHASNTPEILQVNMITGPTWLQKWRPTELPLWQLRVFSNSWKGKIPYWYALLKAKLN